jgi:peptidyl-tRNA hydrolase, PTH1 family
VRRGGGAGGHRGLDSILSLLGEGEFVRFRVGIGRPVPGEEAADFVLKPLGEAERAGHWAAAERCADAVETWLRAGLTLAMNQFNPFPEREREE